MFVLRTKDLEVKVEFRHRHKFTKKPGLMRHAPCDAITTCGLVAVEISSNEIKVISTGTSMCVAPDPFCRRTGRLLSFERAVRDCGVLRDVAEELLIKYEELDMPRIRVEKPPITLGEVSALRIAGQEVRTKRLMRRRASIEA